MAQTAMVAVTGPTIPYIFDLAHILSLPTGFEARFRYFVDLVDTELCRSVDEDPSGTRYSGRDLIVAYHSRHSELLLPVRRGRVLELRRYGPMYYLRFAVTDFPPVDSGLITGPDRESIRLRERERLHDAGVKAIPVEGMDLTSRLPDGAYLRESSATWRDITEGAPKADSQPDRRWAALASLLMYEPELRAVPMFYLEGLLDRQGNQLAPVEMKNHFSKGEMSGFGYQPIQHQRYRLRVLQWRASPPRASSPSTDASANRAADPGCPSSPARRENGPNPPQPEAAQADGEPTGAAPAPQFRVVCRVDPQVLQMEGQSDLIVGRYDVLEYSLRAVGRAYSELELVVEGSGSEEGPHPSWPQVYRTRVPLKVRWNRRRLAATMAVFIVGMALYAVTEIPATAVQFSGTSAALVQLLALGLVYVASADFLSGYVQFATQSAKLTPGGLGRGE